MRGFDFARKMRDGKPVIEVDERNISGVVKAFPDAKIPEYQTKHSAGADFFCASEVVVPSIWFGVLELISECSTSIIRGIGKAITGRDLDIRLNVELDKRFAPTLVHTGVKACMEDDEVLELYNRSSNPKKLGLILANSVGVVDADYFENPDNDGEIMFAFYNFKPWNITLRVGDRIGQGVFKKFLRPTTNCNIKDVERVSGFGSTGITDSMGSTDGTKN